MQFDLSSITNRHRWLHLTTLWGLAVAQPLYQLLGTNAEFFAARHADVINITLFILTLSLLFPLLLTGILALTGRLNRVVSDGLYLAFIALFGQLVALQFLNTALHLDAPLLVVFSLIIGVVWAVGYYRLQSLQSFVSVLAFSIAVFPAMFLMQPTVGKMVFGTETVAHKAAKITKPAPIVMLVLDEFYAAGLLNDAHQIDAVKYPNLAKFSQKATWYNRAMSVADNTLHAVPGLLTGRYPGVDRLPIYSGNPDNLFTWLEGTYQINAIESRTSLCPERICAHEKSLERYQSGLQSTLWDAGMVYLNVVSPEAWRKYLPDVQNDWVGFGATGGGDAMMQLRQLAFRHNSGMELRDREKVFNGFISQLHPTRAGEKPALSFMHILLPHIAYMYLPSGRHYDNDQLIGIDQRWVDNPRATTLAYQRYQYQLGFLDHMLGKLFAQLEREGMFDDTMIVITADHGAGFSPKNKRRPITSENLNEIMPIPLWIKAPGQQQGQVNDKPLQLVDILPTMAEHLGSTLPWKVEGHSVLSHPGREQLSMYDRDLLVKHPAARDISAINAYERQKRLYFPHGTQWPQMFQTGPWHSIFGQPVTQFTVASPAPGLRFSVANADLFTSLPADSAYWPVHLKGVLKNRPKQPVPKDMLIAVNGRLMSVYPLIVPGDNPGRSKFFALLPEDAIHAGKNQIDVFIPEGTPNHLILHPVLSSEAPSKP